MDFITANVKAIYRKYLIASIGSALALSVYSFVDTIAVGQSEGELGTAAMAVISPLYSFLTFFGILCGIGGSVLFSAARGEGREEKARACYTLSLAAAGAVTALLWAGLFLFHDPVFRFFGADEVILPKVMEYAQWVIRFLPFFILPTFLGAFLRNDGAPHLAMGAVIVGGCVNILGDWLLVFALGLGMEGAAIATVIGSVVQTVIMCGHFFRKRCGLRLVRPRHFGKGIRKLGTAGIGSGILDLGSVFIAVLMNNQIMRCGGPTELAVYGVIAAVSPLFQAVFGGVGQAVQPLVSANCGAREWDRVRTFWRLGLTTSLALGAAFTCLGELFPVPFVRMFMDAAPETLAIVPSVFRPYFLLFPPLGVTVLATYFLESILHGKMSMLVALLRSFLISGPAILALPLLLDLTGLWLALPVSECIVAAAALAYIKRRITGPDMDEARSTPKHTTGSANLKEEEGNFIEGRPGPGSCGR